MGLAIHSYRRPGFVPQLTSSSNFTDLSLLVDGKDLVPAVEDQLRIIKIPNSSSPVLRGELANVEYVTLATYCCYRLGSRMHKGLLSRGDDLVIS
ncbi:PRLI-interacting factor G [Corchorus olitorius]|uniref:PRLI-interacting factor G n=1 Tax=Corchorus olitorius TaxID=93759 RepID=A0A1R3H3X0_9ROSI|nr:PRLI-interacting factor G [Corchorus olitorius]